MKISAALSLSLLILPVFAHALANEASALECRLDADPSSQISLAVDESGGGSDVVLLGILGSHQDMTIKSALLPHHRLAQQIKVGAVVVSFGDDVRASTSEIFDGALLAVTRVGRAMTFKGYIALQRDGTSVMPITCTAK